MDSFYLHGNLHTIILRSALGFLTCLRRPTTPPPKLSQCNRIMSNVTPVYATTQLLVSNARPSLTCTLPQRIINLSAILQSNSKIPVASSGIGQIRPCLEKSALIIAAHQPKQPVWTKSHVYIRGPRINPNQLLMLSAESNMIHASKITRPLKPRRPFLSRREDVFVWGKPSPLRKTDTNK